VGCRSSIPDPRQRGTLQPPVLPKWSLRRGFFLRAIGQLFNVWLFGGQIWPAACFAVHHVVDFVCRLLHHACTGVTFLTVWFCPVAVVLCAARFWCGWCNSSHAIFGRGMFSSAQSRVLHMLGQLGVANWFINHNRIGLAHFSKRPDQQYFFVSLHFFSRGLGIGVVDANVVRCQLLAVPLHCFVCVALGGVVARLYVSSRITKI
jgi:hypothetical protein